MAALTIGAFVFRPDGAMASAKAQMSEYSRLRLHYDKMTDAQLADELDRLKPKDSNTLGCFENPAYNRASIEIGQASYQVPLTKLESVIAWLSGDLPSK
ncbi:hypothetical protein D2H34_003462 [Vibrio fluvialis]